ncbi:MAG: hypothetical protein PHU85_10285, partial [Phycisphaerae bacterium]|nr:hypothetical protein [Phycisphaerae bacterium]
APDPLKKNSLAQTLVWDRTDDLGKPLPAGSYQGNFRVVVLDTNGNQIAVFGRYGNQDAKNADLPFALFTGLGVSDRAAYVADGLNRRVTVVKLDHQATATCAVP